MEWHTFLGTIFGVLLIPLIPIIIYIPMMIITKVITFCAHHENVTLLLIIVAAYVVIGLLI